MSWTNELYEVYDLALNIKPDGDEKPLLPISHSTQNAQIEVTITENGEFVTASKIEKDYAETIIPVTEDSGSRSSGISAMPFADKLVYIAGDYSSFAEGKRADNSEYFCAYMTQLMNWADSDFSHKAVRAVYAYLEKKELMKDLLKCSILKIDEKTGKLSDKEKIAGIPQADSFVRFRVNYDDFENNCPETWKDKTLYESFIGFNDLLMDNKQLCYATGKELAVTYKHPSKIRNSGDKAKLISANDESGFTYRGRFADKEETFSVSYEFSQKLHNALKWLINRQGVSINSLTLVVWASGAEKLPSPVKSLKNQFDDDDEDTSWDSIAGFSQRLRECIYSYREKFDTNTKAMIMGLDAATTGRLSIAEYSETEASQYLENIEKWHEETRWLRFNGKKKKSEYNSFSINTIANCAFGNEQETQKGNFVKCKDEVLKDVALKLLPCITDGKKLPSDIMYALYNKASNPLSYENYYNFKSVLDTACGMIHKFYIDHDDKRGMIEMYDESITDRSYLFGCLLAIADKAESETYDKEERNIRVTNARRYWNAFSQRPAQTWKNIEEKLLPYMNKLGKSQVKYQKWINEISDKLDIDIFNNTRLEPPYLLGYHNFTSYMYNDNSNKTEE